MTQQMWSEEGNQRGLGAGTGGTPQYPRNICFGDIAWGKPNFPVATLRRGNRGKRAGRQTG